MKVIITLLILSFSAIHTIGQDLKAYDKIYEKYEDFILPNFKDTQSFAHLFFKKFDSDLTGVKNLSLTIELDKHGYPLRVNYYEYDTAHFNPKLFEEIKKYIIDDCRWEPAYGITANGKQERILYYIAFGWTHEYSK